MYEYKAKIESVYDGDGSFDAIIDLGLNIFIKRKVRLYGVDTPEMRGEQYQAAKVVRDYVRELILNKDVTIKTKKDKSGKYGRLLACIEIDDIDLSTRLIELGYAKEYLGGTKEDWTKEELDLIGGTRGIE